MLLYVPNDSIPNSYGLIVLASRHSFSFCAIYSCIRVIYGLSTAVAVAILGDFYGVLLMFMFILASALLAGPSDGKVVAV